MRPLHEHPLFAGVPPLVVRQVMHHWPRRTFRKGAVIIAQGKSARAAYLLLTGTVEVFYEAPRAARASIIFHRAPFLFGEIELFAECHSLASVGAMSPCEVAEITRAHYLGLLHAHHQVAINLVRLLSNLLVHTGEDRRVKIFGAVEHQLANTLLAYAHLSGEPHRQGVQITHRVSKTALAGVLGCARRSVIRAFAVLESEGVIRWEGARVIIPDVAALQRRSRQF